MNSETRHLRLRELLLGVEGLALLRGLFRGTDEAAQRRTDEIKAILAQDAFAEALEVPILDVPDGYERWSSTYDAPGNPLISAEQPVVWELLERAAPGRALDAPCGTGRHTARLVELGHDVVAVDGTRSMLDRARERVPQARFVEGDLRALPLDDHAVDLAVCALSLEHLEELERPVAELARVLRPGGTLIISESHPFLRTVGNAPFFRDAAGAGGVVRSYNHLHGDYLDAFAAAGLELRRCIEVRFGREQVEMQAAARFFPEATEAAVLGLPAVLIWDLRMGGGGEQALDHVQVAAPVGCEPEARRFYGDLLGLSEIEKPDALRGRGGVWFRVGRQQLHIGADQSFVPAHKAHPALRVTAAELDAIAGRLHAAGVEVGWDHALADQLRFYAHDPWGNRIELLTRARPETPPPAP